VCNDRGSAAANVLSHADAGVFDLGFSSHIPELERGFS
jgi:hypothetical protein